MAKNIIIATDENFKSEVLDSNLPVLVDFWAPWCGPCKMIAPVVEELAEELSGSLKVAKLNTDDNMDTAMEYSIRSIPTLGIFIGGKMVDSIIGAVPKKALKSKLDQYILNVTVN